MSLLFTSCSSDDDNAGMTGTEGLERDRHALVVNEGGFQQANSSLGILDLDSREYLPNQYVEITDNSLGDIFQSIYLKEEIAYMVINNSSKIEILNLETLEHEGTITDLGSPRYMISQGDIAWVSTLFDQAIHTIDLNTGEITGQIDFPGWSEQMVFQGENILVTCPDCHLKYLINPETGTIVDSIFTGENTHILRALDDGRILSFNSGSFDGSHEPVLRLFNQDLELLDSVVIDDLSYIGAGDLNETTDRFYFAGVEINYIEIEADGLGQITTAFATEEPFSVYQLTSGPGGKIYLTNARDFSSLGQVHVYNEQGEHLHQFEAGVVPSRIYFYQ
ncbi:MAG: hypothetical protein EA411_01775 [Saprospirales bacterium]|nr:MAG: hypothetical protein EA411_01775 [Saprospirales bacterium]